MTKIIFQGYNIRPQYQRSDDSVRITIDISQNQMENVKDILLRRLPEGIYSVQIEPVIESM